MQARFMLLTLLVAGQPAWAQVDAQKGLQPPSAGGQPLQNQEQPDGRKNQKVERITHEDAGNRIDELRYGGQTQSIVVQPKANVPAYEIQPGGQRVWNVLKF